MVRSKSQGFCFFYLTVVRGSLVVANVLYSNIVVSEFELHSRYYIHFRSNTFRKVMKSLNDLAMG